jgi:phage terminase large subunit GpA-like protein
MKPFDLLKGFCDGLKPEPMLKVSEWADRHRFLSSTASSEPGLWRTARTPYLREILDKLSANDPAQKIIVMKGAQLGFTEAGCNWIGYVIDVAPGPMLAVMPTDETVKRNSKMRIAPMIEATPRLREKIAPVRSRDGDNSTSQKSFPGGVLAMTGANSAVGLRSMPVRYLFLDEVDAYPNDLDGEGSPVELAMARTRTFARRKIYIVSTPVTQGSSIVEREFAATDQRYFQVPCPHCGALQKLVWEQVRWQTGDPNSAYYECGHCFEPIQERFKPAMLEAGHWICDAPENEDGRTYGYHINSLYSPYGWYSWADAVRDWEDAQKDVNRLKAFTNTVLGLPWEETGEVPAWEMLYNRRENYQIGKPTKDVVLLTAGVDIQKDRIELEIVGWGKGKRSWSIDYRVLIGDTSDRDVWNQLARIVGESWEREDGALLPLSRMCIDSGYNTTHVYDFCRRFDPSRVVPTKGQDKQPVMVSTPRAVDRQRNGKPVGVLGLYNVGVSIIKSELYGWLKLHKGEGAAAPPGFCHFPEYGANYFKGLASERLQKKIIKGYPVWEWHKVYDRNEPLDCRVYARAAACLVGIDRWDDQHFDAFQSGYQKKQTDAPQTIQRRKSDFW